VEVSCTLVRTIPFSSCFHGCETWFLMLIDNRLRLLEDEVIGKCVDIGTVKMEDKKIAFYAFH
jgi:hypothetical protein